MVIKMKKYKIYDMIAEKIKEYEKENGEIELTDEEIIGEWTLHD